jgi:hypothetical protein
MLSFMFALLELFAFATAKLVDEDDLFDARQSVFNEYSDESLAFFNSVKADPVLGWRNYGPAVSKEKNCLGNPIEYRYDAAGARSYEGYDASQAEVIVVGDSYSNGMEVGDNETYPARLSELLGVSVANHGVGGYGPTQSLLNLQQNILRYPRARVVVLGIVYENLYRMVNSYRPVLYHGSSEYTLKPYMKDGQIIAHPGNSVFESVERFQQAAEKAFDDDFWAKPVARFPYSITLGKSLTTNYFRYRKLQREFRKFGKPEYFLFFADEGIKLNLIALLNEYASMARAWDVVPIVVFIPRNRLDTSSASKFIADHRADIDSRLLIGDVAEFPDINWNKFNLEEAESDNICHPSSYGYQSIAQYIAEIMTKSGVLAPP